MALTKDDIDAVAINLLVDGQHTFQVYLTRGGLTQRRGSSDRADPNAILIKAATDYFEPFMAAVPDALLQGESASMEDGGRDGPRHDWRFEFGGGLNSLVYDIAYHAGSAGLPDEFADLVVQAERLTHSWYLAGVAEEMGVPLPAPAVAVEPPAPKAVASPAGKAPSASRGRPAAGSSTAARVRGAGRAPSGPLAPAPRERIALAIFLDLLALSVPYALLGFVFVGGGDGAGPPGAGLVLFAIAEFVMLMIVRRSAGYWLLGLSMPQQGKPMYDPAAASRESNATLAFGTALCALGVSGLTSWTLHHTAVPFFGLGFPLWLSIPLVWIGSAAMILAGALVLRLDLRGVWLGGGVASLALVASATAWSRWPAFVDAATANLSDYHGRPVGTGILGVIGDLLPILVLVVPAALLFGAYESWRRLGRAPVAVARPLASRG
ncbi:MAG: hypothetical protein AB7T31_14460 [Gemmatimonadales bacterium]